MAASGGRVDCLMMFRRNDVDRRRSSLCYRIDNLGRDAPALEYVMSVRQSLNVSVVLRKDSMKN